MRQFLCITFLLLSSFVPANADDAPVETWYRALRDVDREAFQRVLADDARIILKEIQVIQSKGEFIESLDNWEEAAKDLSLTYDADRKGANEIVVEVCYRFASNTYANLEEFTILNDKIVLQTQEKLRDGC
ncbi:MAG: hypothetical protein QNJ29_03595 [Rhizobiaceae bacterium]|nr:hypothetical protein [Rhizobiaceae bacterium]